jgi:protein ImuB
MLWLAIVLPELPLQVFTRAMSAPQALAVASPPPGARVIAANALARAAGVEPGQRPASAFGLLPELQLHTRTPQREHDALTEIALWAGRFTPRISVSAPDTVLLEISASLRLFDGPARIVRALEEGLATLGFRVCCACAPTPLAARWFARTGTDWQGLDPARGWQQQLDDLPLELLADGSGCDAPACALLAGLGLRTLGEARSLPAAGLARRQAQAVGHALACARGEIADPQPWFEAPSRFDHGLPLPAPTHHAEALNFAARRLFASLAAWLQARHAALDTCVLRLEHERSPATVLELVFGHPSHDEQRFALIARERLASLSLHADVSALRLFADHTVPARFDTHDLFGDPAGSAQDAALLLARLRARLGETSVWRLDTHPDHRPERACRTQACDSALAAGEPLSGYRVGARTRADVPDTAPAPRQRPLWLLHRPRPILPERFTLLGGAERIETGWWDGRAVHRDYYRARDVDHVLCWIFRDLEHGGRWFLHGYFG